MKLERKKFVTYVILKIKSPSSFLILSIEIMIIIIDVN